jgi:hypothetical protein
MVGEIFKRKIKLSLDLELTIGINIVLQGNKVGLGMNEGKS